jgi:cytochrome c553
MREPRVFLLAVVGFLALSVLHFAVMKGTRAYDREPFSDPYELWISGAGNEELVSGEQYSGCGEKDRDSCSIWAWLENIHPGAGEDGPEREERADAWVSSCARCHVREEGDTGFP